ncbi:Threonine synthase [bacterium HR33]|nr:Threonine synthase [bacterium HR33]
MRLVSTAGKSPPTELKTALLESLAPDGGLYVPEVLAPLSESVLEHFGCGDFETTASRLARHLLGDSLAPDDLDAIVRSALDFPIPLVRLNERIFALELFHGPTLAFKDVAARFLARLMLHVFAGETRPLTVLVATSGDTGGAVAHAFYKLPNTRVVVLFPEGKVSPVQERQFSTLGENVLAVAVEGTFDDCQRLAKAALADGSLRAEFLLTSANSINIGRLLPQIFYYFHALAQLPGEPKEVIVSVPSGNLGNLTAGLMAKRLGLRVRRFVAATNANDVLREYLRTGSYCPRPARPTVSPAMDVGDPSNLARIQWLYGGDLEGLKGDLEAFSYSDAETVETVARYSARYDYLLDPHSAVAALGLEDALAASPECVGIFLATAHPAKFSPVVERATGRPVPVPAQLDFKGRRSRVERIPPDLDRLKALLRRT